MKSRRRIFRHFTAAQLVSGDEEAVLRTTSGLVAKTFFCSLLVPLVTDQVNNLIIPPPSDEANRGAHRVDVSIIAVQYFPAVLVTNGKR
jgi:hypothetical protein